MATGPITTDELDDRIIAIETFVDLLEMRVAHLEATPTDPAPSGSKFILPIIGYLVEYTVP